MRNSLREKYLVILAVFVGITLAFSTISTANAISSSYSAPSLPEIKSAAMTLLDEHDDEEDDERQDGEDEDERVGDHDGRNSISADDCTSGTINDNVEISEENTELSNCEIDGNVEIEDSKVSFADSVIDGNVESEDSNLTLVKTRISGDVKIEGGSIKLLDSVIEGDLECGDDSEYSIQGTTIKGKIKGCGPEEGNDNGKNNANNRNNNKDDEDDDDESDKKNGKNKGQSKKLKLKVKNDGGRVDVEEDDDEDSKDNQNIGNVRSFPTEFILDAQGGIAIEKGKNGESSKRFEDVSMVLTASGHRLEGNHIRVSVEGMVMLDDNEFEITDGRGIMIFFKNPSKQFFRGIIHVAGVAIDEDGTEEKFHLRALLLPGDEQEGVWSFVVAPAAKLGRDIRIFQLLGQLIESGNSEPTPNPNLDHFEVSTVGTVSAGKLFEVTVTAVDSDGDRLTDYEGRARISDLTDTLEPETTPRFNEGVFKGKLSITEAMSSDKLTFTDTASNKKGTSNAFNVVADSIAKVDLTPSTAAVKPGEKVKFTAKGLDKFGNEITGLNFAWSLSSSGLGTISISDNTAEFTASSTITDEVDVTLAATISEGTLKDSSKITINPHLQTLDHFVFENITSPKTAGALFQITVKAVNSTGNVVKTYGGPMTLTDTTGTLSMTISNGFSNGVWTGNVNITKAASDVKITAKDVANTVKTGASNAFNVVSGSLAKLDVNPSTVTIAPAQKANFTAKGFDKYGNGVSGLTIEWFLSSSNFGSIQTNGNVANFTASSTITANTDVTLTAKVGSIFDESKITIKPANTQVLDHFVIGEIGPQKAGTAFPFTITAVDSTGATVTSYSGPINVNDTTQTLTIVTNNGFTNGVWTGTVKITKASLNVKVTAEDKETPSKKGTSNTFEVKAGDLDHFVFNEIGQQTAGVEFSVTVKAIDGFGNKITDYSGTVELSTNNGNSPAGNTSELSPTPYTFNSDDEGQHTFQVTLFNAKSGVTISVSGSSKTNSSNAFNVVTASIFKVTITPSIVSIPEGEQLDFKAKAVDAFGNTVNGATFSWTVGPTLGTLGSTTGAEVEFTAAAVTENLTGPVTATSGSVSGSATITVTNS